MIHWEVWTCSPWWLFGMTLGGACAQPSTTPRPAYEDILANCDLEVGTLVTNEYASTVPISEACSTALGDAIALDWDSFNTEPHDFIAASTNVEVVIGGALIAFAPNRFSVGDAVGGDPPEALGGELSALAIENNFDDDEPAGQLWLAMVEQQISSMYFDASIETTMTFKHGVVSISDLRDASRQDGFLLAPADVAGIIIHEATHGFLHGHIPCYITEQVGCDDDLDGALGAEAWWKYHWLKGHRRDLVRVACDARVEYQNYICLDIYIDHDDLMDFRPCGQANEVCDPVQWDEHFEAPTGFSSLQDSGWPEAAEE